MTAAQAAAVPHRDAPLAAPLDWRLLVASSAWTALALFVALSMLVAVRRLSGTAVQPLPGPILVPMVAGIAAAVVLLRLWLLPVRPGILGRRSVFWSVPVVPSLALVVLLVAMIVPGTSRSAAIVAILIAASIEGLYWRHLAVALRPVDSAASETTPPRAVPRPDGLHEAPDEEYPPGLVQQLVRTRDAGDSEAIHAVLRAEFQPGEQVHVLHVAFCPPLSAAPELTAFAVSELEATVRVTNSYSFGARVEVHLPVPASEPVSLIVEVSGAA